MSTNKTILQGILNNIGRKNAAIRFLEAAKDAYIEEGALFLLSIHDYMKIAKNIHPIHRDLGVLEPSSCNLSSLHSIGCYLCTTFIDEDAELTLNISKENRAALMTKAMGSKLTPGNFDGAYDEVMRGLIIMPALRPFFKNPTGKAKPVFNPTLGGGNAATMARV